MKSNTIVALNAADASADASYVWNTASVIQASLQCVVTGASTGTLKLQFSNDVTDPTSPNGTAPSNWTDISGASITVAAAGVTGLPKMDLAYGWIKVVWTKNNGSAGTISVNLRAVGV